MLVLVDENVIEEHHLINEKNEFSWHAKAHDIRKPLTTIKLFERGSPYCMIRPLRNSLADGLYFCQNWRVCKLDSLSL